MVTSAGQSSVSNEKSMSGFQEEPGKFIVGVGPSVVSKPVGGSRGRGLACQILARANAAELAW